MWQWKAAQWLAYGAVAAVPLFVGKGQLFGMMSGKTFVAAGLTLLMLLSTAWGMYRDARRGEALTLPLTWLHGALCLFAVVCAASAWRGVDSHASWFGSLHQGTGLIYLLFFMLWSVLLSVLIRRSGAFLERFLAVAYGTGVLVAFLSWFDGGNSTLGNSSFLGAYLLFVVCIGVGFLLTVRNRWGRTAIISGLIITLFSPVFFNHALFIGDVSFVSAFRSPLLFAGQANGALLGVGIAFLIAAGLFATRSRRLWVQIAGGALCVALLVSLVVMGKLLRAPDTTLNRVFIEQKSATRFFYWDIAAAALHERPLLGYGWGNYGRAFQTYFDPIIYTRGYVAEPSVPEPHNVVWGIASTAGVLGLIAYLALIGGTVVVLYRASREDDRRRRVWGVVLAGALVGYFVQNLFIFDTPTSYFLFFTVVGISLAWMPQWRSSALSTRAVQGAAVVLVTAAIAGIVFCVILPWQESRQWVARARGDYTAVLSPQHISVVGNNEDLLFIASYYVQSGWNTSTPQGVFYEKQVLRLVNDFSQESLREPDNYKLFLMKGILENEIVALRQKRDPDILAAAQRDFERALTLNARIPEIYFHFVRTYVYLRDFDSAYKYLRAGIALEPRYGQGYDIADTLLKIAPNRAFEGWMLRMKQQLP